MSNRQRAGRGYASLALGMAALAAATGAAYWYLRPEFPFANIWNQPTAQSKKKKVVVILNQVYLCKSILTWQHILDNLPSYEDSNYVEPYIICPPAIRGHYDDNELLKKVQHPTQILVCSTESGFVYIARHIDPEVVILGQEYFWALEQLQRTLLSHLN